MVPHSASATDTAYLKQDFGRVVEAEALRARSNFCWRVCGGEESPDCAGAFWGAAAEMGPASGGEQAVV